MWPRYSRSIKLTRQIISFLARVALIAEKNEKVGEVEDVEENQGDEE